MNCCIQSVGRSSTHISEFKINSPYCILCVNNFIDFLELKFLWARSRTFVLEMSLRSIFRLSPLPQSNFLLGKIEGRIRGNGRRESTGYLGLLYAIRSVVLGSMQSFIGLNECVHLGSLQFFTQSSLPCEFPVNFIICKKKEVSCTISFLIPGTKRFLFIRLIFGQQAQHSILMKCSGSLSI